MGYQNNILETPEDKAWIRKITLASLPMNYSHLNGFSIVNHHAGRQVAEDVDKTINQIKRHGKTPNKRIADMVLNSPQVWTSMREAMAVVHCNQPNGHTPDDMKIVLGRVLSCLEKGEECPEDIARIVARDLRKYLIDNHNNISLDQAFGLENYRTNSLDPYVVSDIAFALVNELLFEYRPHEKGDFTVLPFKQAVANIRLAIYEEENDIDSEDDEEWDRLGLDGENIKGYWKFKNHFKTYKFQALDYILRNMILNDNNLEYKLSEIQHKTIKKYWKVDMPMKLTFNDRLYALELRDKKAY